QCRQPIELILGPAVFDRYVLALDIAGVFEPLAKSAQTIHQRVRRPAVEHPDHRHCGLLRLRSERPRCRAAEQRHELAAPQLPKSHGAIPSQGGSLADRRASSQVLAALRDGDPAYVSFGSNSTKLIEGPRPCMSALPLKADIATLPRYVRFVP